MSGPASPKKPPPIDRKAALAKNDLFRGVSPAELDAIAAKITWRSFEKGRSIIEQEAGSSDVYLIGSGKVRITIYAASGREVAFRDLGEGATFGELSAVDGRSRSTSVIAIEDTWMATISRDLFWSLLRERPAVVENVVKGLVALVRNLTERVVDYSTLGVRNRIQAEIVRMAREQKTKGPRVVITPSPKHADIASRVSTNREEVAREFGHLTREKLIERGQGQLIILDLPRLVNMVERVRED
jgi:CRP-like cAMP-binding protein